VSAHLPLAMLRALAKYLRATSVPATLAILRLLSSWSRARFNNPTPDTALLAAARLGLAPVWSPQGWELVPW
jgi:hypothetical protein